MYNFNSELFKKVLSIEAPSAKIVHHPFNEHGIKRVDPYHWMRLSDDQKNSGTPDEHTKSVLDYIHSENNYREELTAHLKEFEGKLYEEIKGRIKQTDMSVPYKDNGYYYLTRFEEGNEYPIFVRHNESLDSSEEILLDVNRLARNYDYYDIGDREISPDNNILAYSEDTVSRRQYTILFKNLLTGELFPDSIPNTSGSIVWANDNLHVFYTIKDSTLRDYKIYRHKLGTPVEQDEMVYHEMDESYHVYIFKTKSKKYLVIGSSATLSDEFRYLDADNPIGTFQLFQGRLKNLEYEIEHYQDYWYVLTNSDSAYNFKIMRVELQNTQKDNWKDFIHHHDQVFIEGFDLFKDFMAIAVRRGGITQIDIAPWGGELYTIPFAEESYTVDLSTNPEMESDMLRLSYTSLTTPNTIYDFNTLTKEFVLLKRQEVIGDFESKNYISERKLVKVEDGTQVPVSIVYHKDFRKDSSRPLLLYGYGSYGLSIDPVFSSYRLSLLNRGFVFAIAHIRGGQEMGRRWYENGKLFKKKNTFTDFISCALYLKDNAYCNPSQMFAMGGSAGGLLIGAVINERPDIWAGVIAAVPFVDVVTTMFDESIPLTTGEFDEWGNPKQKEYFEYMLSYSPYDNVSNQEYPPMLITTGFHDSQVQYWEPLKWIAKLRKNKKDNNPLILYCDMAVGHGGASGRFKRIREIAMEYTFLLELSGRINN